MMLKISSRDNQRIKQARKVRESLIEDAIFVEGLRLAEEVLRSNLEISDIFFTDSFSQTERGQVFLRNVENFNSAQVSEKIFNSLSDTKTPQGIILICERPETNKKAFEALLQTDSKKLPHLVLLHQINNPTNQGAILRTCEAVGVSGVILTKNSADIFSPKALRGAMGASLRLPIWSNVDFFDVISWARRENFTSVCADVNAKKSYLEIDWKKPRLLVFGSEAHGLSQEERNVIDESLIIPMENQVESLNLAVSSGVILYEAKRQRDNKKGGHAPPEIK
jgi:TrmH family RNA methyltransferase